MHTLAEIRQKIWPNSATSAFFHSLIIGSRGNKKGHIIY